MKRRDLSQLLTDTLDTDFKAEVIAAEMIENKVPAEEIIVISLGPSKRSFRRDVDAVSHETSDYNNKEYTHITTHKEGLYDMLPEGLFHSPTLPKSATSQKEIIDAIKIHQSEERNARRFFLPYEAVINDLRIQMALYESKLDKGARHNELVDIFKNYWEIFKYLDTNQSNIFLKILPLIHDLREDYDIAKTIFELLLLTPVAIIVQLQRPLICDTSMFPGLDDVRLGVNFITASRVYDSYENEIIVRIGPLANAQLKEFSPGSGKRKILDLLCDYFFPVHLDVSIEFDLSDSDKVLMLADGVNDFNATIGFDTYL